MVNEFRLDPESLSFTLITNRSEGCKACKGKGNDIASAPFMRGRVKVYEIKDDVQPSKYELSGEFFKSSLADGYEEVVVDSDNHENKSKTFTVEEIEQLLSILEDRINSLDKYKLGQNMMITRTQEEHGYFDLLLLPIPRKETKGCFECESLKNASNREIYSTENFLVYVPFAPRSDFEIVVAPKRHIGFGQCDPMLLFDLAGVVKKLSGIHEKEATWAISQNAGGHFKLKFLGGKANPYDLLEIKIATINPDLLAKEIRETKKL